MTDQTASTTYEQLLTAARNIDLAPLGVDEVRQRMVAPGRSWQLTIARLGIGSAIFGLVGVSAIALWTAYSGYRHAPTSASILPLVLPVALLLFAAVRVTSRSLVTQLAIRAILWSNVFVGTIASNTSDDPRSRLCGLLVTLGCVVAALCLRRTKPTELANSTNFQPVAFENRLSAALIMACADAQTLFFAGMLNLSIRLPIVGDGSVGLADFTAIFAALIMGIIVWGLVQMRTWALVVNILANLAIATGALYGLLGVPLLVAGFLSLTALVQLMLPVPLWAAAMGDDVREESTGSRRTATLFVIAAASLLIAASGFGAIGYFYWGMYDWQTNWEVASRQRASAEQFSGTQLPADEQLALVRGPRGSSATLELTKQELPGLQLPDIRPAFANLSGSRLPGSNFAGALLPGSRFDESHVQDSSFESANLNQAAMRYTSLIHTNFQNAQLQRTDFEMSDLRQANFTGADLERAWLSGANLEGAIWQTTRCPNGVMSDDTPDGSCEDQLGQLPEGYDLGQVADQQLWFAMEGAENLISQLFWSFSNPRLLGYRAQLGFAIIERHGARWLAVGRWSPGEAVVYLGKDRFAEPESGDEFAFVRDATGTITAIDWHYGNPGSEAATVRYYPADAPDDL